MPPPKYASAHIVDHRCSKLCILLSEIWRFVSNSEYHDRPRPRQDSHVPTRGYTTKPLFLGAGTSRHAPLHFGIRLGTGAQQSPNVNEKEDEVKFCRLCLNQITTTEAAERE